MHNVPARRLHGPRAFLASRLTGLNNCACCLIPSPQGWQYASRKIRYHSFGCLVSLFLIKPLAIDRAASVHRMVCSFHNIIRRLDRPDDGALVHMGSTPFVPTPYKFLSWHLEMQCLLEAGSVKCTPCRSFLIRRLDVNVFNASFLPLADICVLPPLSLLVRLVARLLLPVEFCEYEERYPLLGQAKQFCLSYQKLSGRSCSLKTETNRSSIGHATPNG